MPGRASLEKGEYYGHPRNHFWKIIYGLFGMTPQREYRRRLDFLMSRGIALWDVLAACSREGSSDQAIRNEQYNDILALLETYPSIRLIACNGSKAERSLRRGLPEGGSELERRGIVLLRFPSTSPIPTRRHKSWEDKLIEWSRIADFLEEAHRHTCRENGEERGEV
jgi:TDG/mug DNA glycosylase family protein